MSSIAEKINEEISHTSMAQINGIFDTLKLPIPEDGEYIKTRLGFIVPLTEYGSVLRIEGVSNLMRQDYPFDKLNNNPYVIPTLGTLGTAHHINVELCPGIQTVGITEAEHESIKRKIEKNGLRCKAGAEDDCGYIPDPENPSEYLPVVLDRSDIETCPTSTRWHPRSSAAQWMTDKLQTLKMIWAKKSLYGDLQKAFYKAKKPSSQDESVHEFWSLCRNKTVPEKGKASTLFAAWNEEPSAIQKKSAKALDYHSMISAAADKYSARLQRSPFHQKIIND